VSLKAAFQDSARVEVAFRGAPRKIRERDFALPYFSPTQRGCATSIRAPSTSPSVKHSRHCGKGVTKENAHRFGSQWA